MSEKFNRDIRLEYSSELANLAKPFDDIKKEIIAGSRFEKSPINFAKIDMTDVETLEFIPKSKLSETILSENEIEQVKYGLNYIDKTDYRHYLATLAKNRSFAVHMFFTFENVEYAMMSIHRHRAVLPTSILMFRKQIESSSETTDLQIVEKRKEYELATLDFSAAEEEMRKIEDFESGELSTMLEDYKNMKLVLENKAREMYEMQLKMKAELSARMEVMKTRLYILDTEIYALDCRFGFSVDFVQLRAGVTTETSRPLIINQKTQFLDEDIARFKLMYDLKTNDLNQMLVESDEVFNHLMSSDKCVTFIKKSKNDSNLEEVGRNRYRLMKEKMPSEVGILVRNGENLWLSWCDADRIQIKDDSFASNATHEKTTKELVSSRYFIFNIILGLLDEQRLIQLDERIETVKDLTSSRKIIFSDADSSITDTRYLTMSEYFYKTSRSSKFGDKIFVMNQLSDGEWVGGRFGYASTDRGKGHSTLTFGSRVSVGLNQISAMQYSLTDRELYAKAEHGYSEVIRPNFRVFHDEIFNFENLTSNILKYWLTTKRTGDFWQNGYVADFAHLSKQISQMIEDIASRENEELRLVDAVDSNYSNIDLIASFKLIKNVRNFTEYQAKRFVKWAKSLSKEDLHHHSQYLEINQIDKYLTETKYIIKFRNGSKDFSRHESWTEERIEKERTKYLCADGRFSHSTDNLRAFSSESSAKKKIKELLDEKIKKSEHYYYKKFVYDYEIEPSNYSILEVTYDEMNRGTVTKEIKYESI